MAARYSGRRQGRAVWVVSSPVAGEDSGMDLFTSPLMERLAPARHVLIAGGGGGFDVFSGLPLYFRLHELGKTVTLANLSFTQLSQVQGTWPVPGVLQVEASTEGPEHYFPEGWLSRWFARRGEQRMPRAPSIVSLSVVSALEGDYGDIHRTERTRGSTLWINPLMSMYWAFDLMAVARRCLYLEALKDTTTQAQMHLIIEAFRAARPVRPWKDIPV
ncbi:hypothetical protein NVS55_39885 [Myxococcus stipitatus]|uniref:hypothetical protein n=1 Tax=Myxococcus stipitatus TaxID=83455 RepID=UPI0031455E05